MKKFIPKNGNSISGSSGKSSAPVRFTDTPNSVRSTSQLRLMSVVSAGPIEGLGSGMSSLKIDGIPVVSPADESVNISGITWQLTKGDDGDEDRDGFNAVEQTELVNTTLLPATPYSRAGQGDAAILTFRFPQGLVHQNDAGIFGSSVNLKFETRQPDGTWVEVASPVISEKQTTFFETQFTIEFKADYKTAITPAVRVTRITPAAANTETRNSVMWLSVTWVKHDQLSYQGLSMLTMTMDSERFGQRLPRIDLDVKGRHLRLPNNYDPEKRAYTGIWSGGFKLAFSNNPAWVVFDLLTDRHWGLALADNVVEVYDLYAIARYADEEVDDGSGGKEPRFIFDAVLSRRQSAYELIQQICASMRVMMFWSGGRLRFTQDKSQDAVMWLTNHHVEEGMFIYTTSGSQTQFSHALVSYQDPNQPSNIQVEAETRPDVLSKQGYSAQEVALLGCRRRSQARRHARWLLDKADAALHGVSWRASLDHFAENPIRPGDVVRVVDNFRIQPKHHSGRAQLSSSSPVTLPQKGVYFNAEFNFTEGFVDHESQDGGWQVNTVVKLAKAEDGNTIITPKTAWPHEPVDQGAMVVKTTASASSGQDYRVVAVRELDRNRVEVDAIRHDNSRFDAIESNLDLSLEATSNRPDFTTLIPAPTGLKTHQPQKVSGQEGLRHLVVAWTPPIDARIAHWLVVGAGPDGEQTSVISASSPAVLNDLAQGTWALTITAVDWLGNKGHSLEGTAEVKADPIVAKPPTSPSVTAGYGQLVLSWDRQGLPHDGIVEVLQYPSATSTKPTIIEATGSSLILVGQVPDVMAYFRLRTRLRGGSLSAKTSLLSAAAKPLPKDGTDGADGKDGNDGADGSDGNDGADGSDGNDGADGSDGADGADGSDGADGKDGSDGKDGASGTVMAQAEVSNRQWSNAKALTAVTSLRPNLPVASQPIKGDMVTLVNTNTSNPWAETRVYTGTAWKKPSAVLSGDVLADQTVPASRLKLDATKLAQQDGGDGLTIKSVPADLISTGVMRSTNYQKGSSGFMIDTAGEAEFNNATIRGVLESSRIEGSTIIAATSVIPTDEYSEFFTLEQPRMMNFGTRNQTSSSLSLGPFEVNRSRHSRRFNDGGQVVLAANNPFNDRNDKNQVQKSASGERNSYYTRFWSSKPSIVVDCTYEKPAGEAGFSITSGTIQIKLRTSGNRQIAASSVQSIASLLGWHSNRSSIAALVRLDPWKGFAGGASGKLIRETSGANGSGVVTKFRLWLEIRAGFTHHKDDGDEDGLVVEILLNLGSSSKTQAVLSQFYYNTEIDASTHS